MRGALTRVAQVPLLGFVPWGMVEGRQALWEPEADGRVAPHVEKLPVEEFQMHEKHFHAVCGSRLKAMRVDRGHSHLFFVDDGTVGQFGNEARIRAAFEVLSLALTPHPAPPFPLPSDICSKWPPRMLGWKIRVWKLRWVRVAA